MLLGTKSVDCEMPNRNTAEAPLASWHGMSEVTTAGARRRAENSKQAGVKELI